MTPRWRRRLTAVVTVSLVTLPIPATASAPLVYDVVVVGAGTGGVAAALQAARMGRRVALVEETDWIGGQLTAGGVGTLDGKVAIRASASTASSWTGRGRSTRRAASRSARVTGAARASA